MDVSIDRTSIQGYKDDDSWINKAKGDIEGDKTHTSIMDCYDYSNGSLMDNKCIKGGLGRARGRMKDTRFVEHRYLIIFSPTFLFTRSN